MPSQAPDHALLDELRARRDADGAIFWINETDLAVFDAAAAAQVNAANFAEFVLNDKLTDILRGRQGKPVEWRQVRSVWLRQMRQLSQPEHVAALARRMSAVLDARVELPLHLTWLAYEVCIRSLIPMVIDGLDRRDAATLARDLITKVGSLVGTDRKARRNSVGFVVNQTKAGSVVRRELRGRATGRRPSRLDLVDPLATELLPMLGISRAVEVATAMLTAITGPPGSSAASVLYELSRRPDWAHLLTTELQALSPDDLYRAPLSRAPLTLRFIKEVLRLWSPPLLLNRRVRTDINLPGVTLRPSQQYVMCPYLVHRDAQRWHEPDVFDPDRWLPDAHNGPATGDDYTPFGWAPTTCVGAGIGTIQLILLCHLVCTRYDLTVPRPENARMALLAVPTPVNFHGHLAKRNHP